MVTCFDWKFHEILLNTVYLRKLSDVYAVDVRVLHNVSHYALSAQTSVAYVESYVSAFFLSACMIMQFVLDKNSTTLITAH